MSTRASLDAELDRLAAMLPPWRQTLRHEAQFWPQFTALAQEILAQANPDEERHVRQRLDAMLAENGIVQQE